MHNINGRDSNFYYHFPPRRLYYCYTPQHLWARKDYTICQLLLAKASKLVAVLPSTREWRLIETQRLAG